MIPKLIYKCCGDKTQIDDRILRDIEIIKDKNPGYKFFLYDDNEMEAVIEDFNKDLFKSYLKINPKYGAARADFFRYVCLYKTGGIYLDLKSTATKPLDTIILNSDKCIISHWDNNDMRSPYFNWGRSYPIINKHLSRGEFVQWAIISEPNHIFLEKTIEMVVKNIETYDSKIHGVGKNATCITTGPLPYTLAIIPYLVNTKIYRLTNFMVNCGIKYTLLSNNKEHESVFKGHYSKLKEPVILNKDSL